MKRILLFCAALLVAWPSHAQQEDPASPRARTPVTILQINDVYSTLPVDGIGGLARVATLKQQMKADGQTPILVLAGDFLSPSVASSVFKGEQMIAALNATGVDFATLGNHEFDFGIEILRQRMAEAKWQWVVSNVIDKSTGKPVGGALPYVIKTYGSLKVGFIGLAYKGDSISPDHLEGFRIDDPLQAAARYVPVLKRLGATVIVAITHLTFADDRDIVRRFPDIDLVVGGHEHYPITAVERGTLISKAGSDARWVARLDLNRPPKGPLERFFELVPITNRFADDPATAAVIASYESRLDKELDTVVGTTRVALDASTIRLRAAEGNIGNFFADAMRADVQSEIAIVNSGAIRGDRVFPAGPITRRTILTMHPFENVVCKLAVPGRIVLQALENGVSQLPLTAGRFPQVSGLTMRVDATKPVGSRVANVTVNGQPLDPNRVYTVATADFMVKGGDGYGMFAGQRQIVDDEAGDLMIIALEKYVTAMKELNPAVEGRITVVR